MREGSTGDAPETPRGRRTPPEAASMQHIEALVRRLRRVVGPVRPEAWREVDLTITQLKALFMLDAHPPLSLGALAEALGVSPASASALVERVVRLDLVERREDPRDRRQLQLRLAPEGEALLARLEDRAVARLRTGLERMSPHGLAALEMGLADLAQALDLAVPARPRPVAGSPEAARRATATGGD